MTMNDETQRTRQHGDTARLMTEDLADTLRAGLEGLETMARTLQEVAERSVGAVSELACRASGQSMQGFGLADGELYGLTAETSQNLRAVAKTSTALAHAVEEVSREWIRLSERRLRQNLDGLQALARCRSTTEFLAVQSSFVLDNLEWSVEASRRFAEIAIRMADEATKTITVQAEKTTVQVEETAQRTSRVA
ncbi:hypothetical protein DC522_28610 [Microvirga sp. KLBC 81]|uniref:phasin family protein n=1 Tax=Microvirga sp. KLBC 81 TaxID=1862707 RepID=UPI000D5085BA|nr:phasin family protein [Microvirga sp. KLBC 81]PVE21073.1 hypothetical protein DC522_28610 [Microvirga sp. KLBC 81]